MSITTRYVGNVHVYSIQFYHKLISQCARQCVQVYSHDILGYTGEGKPPRIMMLFTPDSEDTTPPDLQMITSFAGAIKESKLLQIDRVAE